MGCFSWCIAFVTAGFGSGGSGGSIQDGSAVPTEADGVLNLTSARRADGQPDSLSFPALTFQFLHPVHKVAAPAFGQGFGLDGLAQKH